MLDPSSPTVSWPFLSRHAQVLVAIAADPTITIREIGIALNVTERHALNLVLELKAAGYIESEKEGRGNRYSILEDRRLRNPRENHRTVGELTEFAMPTGLTGSPP